MVWVMWSFSKLGQIGMDENTRFKFDTLVDISINSPYIKILQKGAWLWSLTFLVERQALVRLDLCFRSVYLFIYFYPGISSEPLNLSQQKFARWRQLVRNRTWWVWIFEFLRGVRLGAKNVTFCPDLPGVTTKYNMAPKRRSISKIENSLVLAR